MKDKKQAPKAGALVEWKIPAIPDKKAIEKRAAGLLAESKDYEIKSQDHYVASWALVERHDQAMAKIEELFDPFIGGLHKLHLMACAMKKQFLAPLLASKNGLLGKRFLYRGLAEAAQKKRDEEAARLLAAQAKKDLEKQAKIAEKSGDKQTAEVIRKQKEDVTQQVFFSSAPAVPKQQGSVIKERWTFTIVDPAAVEREYCSPDPKLIRPVVESLGPLCKISGLKIERETKEHSRAVNE